MSETSQEEIRPRRRAAKGRRPYFLDDPDNDRLLAMIIALTGEISVLKERVDTHEQLALAGQVATPDAIEAYEPDDSVDAARETWRTQLLGRVFRIIQAAQPDEDLDAAEREFVSLIDEVAKD